MNPNWPLSFEVVVKSRRGLVGVFGGDGGASNRPAIVVFYGPCDANHLRRGFRAGKDANNEGEDDGQEPRHDRQSIILSPMPAILVAVVLSWCILRPFIRRRNRARRRTGVGPGISTDHRGS